MRICGQRYNFTDNSLWNNIGLFCKPLDNKLFVLYFCNQITNHEKKEKKVYACSTAYGMACLRHAGAVILLQPVRAGELGSVGFV